MTTEFKKKLIEVTIEFWNGSGYSEKKTFSGLHTKSHIENLGSGGQSFATLHIFGMSHADMNRLTVTGAINQVFIAKHKVMVAAGEVDGLMQVVHTGAIDIAYIDSQIQPSRAFVIESRTALTEQLTAVKATSFEGSKQVSAILAELVKDANLTLVDKGIGTMPLDNAYFTGDPISKIKECCESVGIEYDINNGFLTVWLSGKEQKSGIFVSAAFDNVPLMIGTPSCASNILTVATQFFTGFKLSEHFEIKSTYNEPASGLWIPNKISYDLECLNPKGGGMWRTVVDCFKFIGGQGG